MIKINLNDECWDPFGGVSYSGTASYDGITVKEVLEEIKEYSKSNIGEYIGEGFGNPEIKHCGAWGIKINYLNYVGNWAGWKNNYDHRFDNKKVLRVEVSGGWYSFFNFEIICEN